MLLKVVKSFNASLRNPFRHRADQMNFDTSSCSRGAPRQILCRRAVGSHAGKRKGEFERLCIHNDLISSIVSQSSHRVLYSFQTSSSRQPSPRRIPPIGPWDFPSEAFGPAMADIILENRKERDSKRQKNWSLERPEQESGEIRKSSSRTRRHLWDHNA